MHNNSPPLRSARVPASQVERSLRSAGLFMRLGANAGTQIAKDFLRTRDVDVKTAVLSPQNIQTTVKSLKHLRGAAMKFGQLVSLDDSVVLTPELAAIFAELRDTGYAMPPKQLRQVLDRNWGAGWHKKFKSFDVHPIAAASIGQVHRAKLKTGEDIAIKVQFPNMRRTIDGDVSTLKTMVKTFGLAPDNLDIDHYASLARDQLIAETDYLQEASNLRKFAIYLKDDERYRVPKVYDEYCTEDILVMSLENGVSLECVRDWSDASRNRVGHDLLNLILREIFEFNHVQTDPNLANYLIDPDTNQLILLDFGACVRISDKSLNVYQSLLNAGMTLSPERIKQVLLTHDLLPPELSTAEDAFIDQMLRTVLSELKAADLFSLANTRVFELLDLNDIKLYTALLPHENLPVDLIFTQRKIIGFVLFLRSLGAQLPVLQILTNYAAHD
jgi:predicted unusual protein kinase regulating ubiquinone biosynthesis (AarF/ABC1/UbiB family)